MSKMQTMLRAALEETTTEEIIGEDITMNDDIVVVEEINTAETELRMTEEAIDVLEETEESLEEITAKMEEAIENDEASEETVMFLNMALNVTMRNAGADSVVAGVESFGDHKAALQAGLEAAEESKEGVMAAIKKFVAEMWEKLVTWFKSVFTAVGRMKKAAAALAKADLKGTVKESEVEIGKKAAKLMLNGKAASNVSIEVATLVSLTGKVGNTNDYLNSIKDFTDLYLDAIDKAIEDPEYLETKEFLGAVAKNTGVLFDHYGLDHYTGLSKEILGQVNFASRDVRNIFNRSLVTLVPVKDAKSGEGVKFNALSANDIKNLAGNIVKLAETLEKMDKGTEAMKKFSKDYAAKYDEVVKRLKDKGVGTVGRSKASGTARRLRRLVIDTHKPIAALVSHTFGVLSAALSYAMECKKNLKEA